MYRISGIPVPLSFTFSQLPELAAKCTRIPREQIASARLSRKSVDARKKNDIHFVLSIDISFKQGVHFSPTALPHGVTVTKIEMDSEPVFHFSSDTTARPLVVGLGPAGLFAALTLARHGMRPIVIERGRDVDARAADVRTFWQTGALDSRSNVQFGEGGAGTFSDGKLTTGISDPRIRDVLNTFCEAGAPEEILFEAKPHIGTDKLPGVVRAIREQIRLLGGDVFFSHRLTDIHTQDGRIAACTVQNAQGEALEWAVQDILLAVGHSARDTFEMLFQAGAFMTAKPFSVGVRIEHLQEKINRAQYGASHDHPALGAADYKLSAQLRDGRGIYTFCNCPGGDVVAAASETGGLVTNGMSAFARAGRNANSALLVGVSPGDFGTDDPLAGVRFQQKWERAAYLLGGENYFAPAQLVGDFLQHVPSRAPRDVLPTYAPGVRYTALDDCLPPFVADGLREGLPLLDRKMPGFAAPEALLTGIETRSSSPLRIVRDEAGESSIKGLFPCGEGAGYAGGITSAAVDGIRAAESVLRKYTKEKG